MKRKPGVVKDSIFLEHQTGDFHPESPQRLEALYSMLEESDVAGRFKTIEPRPCERLDLERVHESRYIDLVASTAGKPRTALDPDTQTSSRSYEAALAAAGGCLKAVDLILAGEVTNVFAMVRPPGHHAEKARAMGFCLFNNVAVAARYAQAEHGLSRIMIVDWDLHHGNGTQNAFYEDETVLYASTHQYPYFPGSGAFNEIGRGIGEGFTVNVPLHTGHGDGEYLGIYRRIFAPIGRAFRPDLLIVSAGFDTYEGDPLGGMSVSPEGFALLTRLLVEMAEELCDGRVLVTLEGGYNLHGLREGGKMVLKELAGISEIERRTTEIEAPVATRVDALMDRVRKAHGERWTGVLQ